MGQKLLIAPKEVGLERDIEPWLLPDTAYPVLEDMFIFRGRLRRRTGFTLLDRLRRFLPNLSAGNTTVSGSLSVDLFVVSGIQSNFEPDASLDCSSVSISVQPGGGSEQTFSFFNGNVIEETDASGGYVTGISSISNANPAILTTTSNHNYVLGQTIVIQGVTGLQNTDSGESGINDLTFTVGNITPSTLEISGLDSTSLTRYISGGTCKRVSGTLTSTGITWPLNMETFPVLPNQPVSISLDYFPCLPAMGLSGKELSQINFEQLNAFDTRYAYKFDKGTQEFNSINTFVSTSNPFLWTGSDSDFFWTVNYLEAFWATNNVAGMHQKPGAYVDGEGDGIRWYDGTGWSNFNPRLRGTSGGSPIINFLKGARIIIPYKDRLVCLSTIEGNDPGNNTLGSENRFRQRARWCQNGTPFPLTGTDGTNSPFPSGLPPGSARSDEAWRDDIPGRGGFIDAPTNEQIISAAFIKDVLVVFFERSSWQLNYTGNEVLPFLWERINSELGSESTFSSVQFDKGIFSVGDKGIISCDGVNTQRIDDKIPDEVYNFSNSNEGVNRIHGIRQFNNKLVFWTYSNPDVYSSNLSPLDKIYPNRVLVFNYREGSWSIYNDSFTVFGEFQQDGDRTWNSDFAKNTTWGDSSFSWSSAYLQDRFPSVVAGNHQGFIVKLQERIENSPTRHISDITTGTPNIIHSTNHNLENNNYIVISDSIGISNINNIVFRVSILDKDSFSIQKLIDSTTTPPNIGSPDLLGTYGGNGVFKVLNNFNVLTKRFNPFIQEERKFRIKSINLFLDSTSSGNVEMQILRDQNSSDPSELKTIPTFSVNPPLSDVQSKLWFKVYCFTVAQFLQFRFNLNELQMFDQTVAESPFTLHALLLDISPCGRLTGFS